MLDGKYEIGQCTAPMDDYSGHLFFVGAAALSDRLVYDATHDDAALASTRVRNHVRIRRRRRAAAAAHYSRRFRDSLAFMLGSYS